MTAEAMWVLQLPWSVCGLRVSRVRSQSYAPGYHPGDTVQNCNTVVQNSTYPFHVQGINAGAQIVPRRIVFSHIQ